MISAIARTHLARLDFDITRPRKPCFVLGSAPGSVGPPGGADQWTVICVNASQVIAESWGVSVPDITVMSEGVLGNKPENIAARQALEGRACRTLVLVKRRRSPLKSVTSWLTSRFTAADLAQHLAAIGYGWERLVVMSHWQRSRLAWEATGAYLAAGYKEEKISTGFFAMFLAHHLDGAPIVIDGFSLSQHGHGYDDRGYRRQHIDMDRKALAALRKLSHLYTANPAIAAEAGIPLYDEHAAERA